MQKFKTSFKVNVFFFNFRIFFILILGKIDLLYLKNAFFRSKYYL